MTRTIDAFVGQQIRALRLDARRSHEFVAFRLRERGFNWSRSQLALVEAGRRGITLGEWLMLPAALTYALGRQSPLTYPELIPETQERLALTPQLTALNDTVVQKLVCQQGVLVSFGAGKPFEEQFDRLVPTTERPYQDDASYNAARHFHVPMEAITKAAERLWQHPLSVERDRRLTASGKSGRTLQALKGHLSRQLFRELAPQLTKMGYGKPRKGGHRPTKGRKKS